MDDCTKDEAMLLCSLLEIKCKGKAFRGLAFVPLLSFYKDKHNTFPQAIKRLFTMGNYFSHGHHALRVMRAPFEELPLHINQKSPEAQAVFQWRMELGR